MANKWRPLPLLLTAALASALASDVAGQAQDGFFGKYIGKLKSYHHGVSGDVFAVDSRTLHIRDFTYDGEGPAAYFYVGTSKSPGPNGIRIADEKGSDQPLSPYKGKHITLTLPETSTLNTIKWFSVWCDEYTVNFGDVRIPKNLEYPKPQKIEGLDGVHAVSSDSIVIVDAQTLLIPNFSYDGEAPDAKFWVGRGAKPSPQGVRVPDENGQEEPLRRYDRKTIVLTLPGDLTVFDIGHFGVWCEAFAVDFGHVRLPTRGLNVPPSLRMLGVSPQSKLNCEVLYEDLEFEVRWAVAGDSIVMQLVGTLGDGEYMSFGLSGDDSRSQMNGGDVVVAWVDKHTLKGYAEDYFLDSKSQCAGIRGSCPDNKLRERTNSVRMLNAAMVNGYSIVTYQRPLKAQDELDRSVFTNGSQAVIWSIGPLNARREVSYHRLTSKGNLLFDFGRMPKWNCPLPEMDRSHKTSTKSYETSTERQPQRDKQAEDEVDITNARETVQSAPLSTTTRRPLATPAPAPTNDAWEIPPIQCYEPEDGVFYAQMGPTGGKRGYPAITGHVGWGISWYINGLLIPEINVVRGKTYTFVVEGGVDPEIPARYHPFYITDDPVGGYEYKTPEERAEVRVFAGVRQTRRGAVPTGTGRLCNWTPDPKQPPADEFASFGAYQRTLTLQCDEGEPGVVQWTPDRNTPDVVYYQCYTHRYLGWKINVLDSCDYYEAASELVSSHIAPDDDLDAEDEDGELQSRPSIRITTRVKPNGIFPDFKDHASTPDNLEDSYPKEFSMSANTHLNSAQNLYVSKSTKPVTSNTNTGDDSRITDPFLPQQEQKKEPEKITKNANSTTYHLPQVTELNQESNENQPPEISKYKTQQITFDSLKTSPVSTQYFQINRTLSTIDPMRRPIVHATTPYSVLTSSQNNVNVENATEQKLDADKVQLVEESQQSEVAVSSNGISPKNMTKKAKPLKSAGSLSTPAINNLLSGPHLIQASMPQNFGITRLPPPISVHPQIPYQRPPHLYNAPPVRRPIPPRVYPRPLPSASMYRPHYAPPNAANFKTNPKKPFYRMPVVMASSHHPLMVTPSFTHRPLIPNIPPRGPLPHHHMTTIKYFPYSGQNSRISNAHKKPPVLVSTTELAPKSIPTTTVVPLPDISDSKAAATTNENQTSNVPSDSSASSLPKHENVVAKPLPVAINTGFHPESVVVEGGFKPIVTKKVIAEDRSSLIDKEGAGDEKPEVTEHPVVQEEQKENPFEGQQPETFEPMFIPSPPDRIIAQQNISEKHSKKPLTLAEDLMPPALGIDHRHSPQTIRKPPHPHVIRHKYDSVRRPLHGHKVIAHYHLPARSNTPSFRNQQTSQQDDETAMAAERMDIYYLPPEDFNTNDRHQSPPSVDGDLPPGAVVTYDGKPVIDSSLASSIPNYSIVSSKQQPTGTAALLQGTPQFGPYLGEIPPPVPDDVHPESIPQLQNQRQSNLNPESSPSDSSITYGQITQLTSLKQLEAGDDSTDMLLPEATDIKEVQVPPENQLGIQLLQRKQVSLEKATTSDDFISTETTDDITHSQVLDDTSEATTTLKEVTVRVRRSASPHHSPEHDTEHNPQHTHEYGDHDHHSEHNNHDHQLTGDGHYKLMTAQTHPSNGALTNYSISSVILMALFISAVLKFLDGVAQ